MRVFLDTNVILEFFLDREDGKTAGRSQQIQFAARHQ